jgi:heterotetrameric sarcosine oxidase gamma subunit
VSDLSIATERNTAPLGLALETAPHYYTCGVRGRAGAEPGVVLQLVVGEDRFNIEARRGKTDALFVSLRKAFGRAPLKHMRTVEAGGFDFVNIGPSRWHAISRERGAQARRTLLREAIHDLATMIDVAHGFIVFRLTGPMVIEALIKLVHVDLDPAVFSLGACITTELHGMTVQLRRTCDGNAYECAVSRSFGGSLFHALACAADPFGLLVQPAWVAR